MKFYPGDTITLTVTTTLEGSCYFEFAGPSAISEELAEPVSTGYTATLSATETTSLEPGVYSYRAYVISSGEVTTIETGKFEIAQLGAKSKMREALEAIEAAIAGHATRVQMQTTVGKTQIQYMTHTELLRARAELKTIVNAEEAKDKNAFGTRKIYLQF